jgi:hypothetical protein
MARGTTRTWRIGRLALGALLLHAGAGAAASLPADVRTALDAVLACERREGGWTYVCDPPTGPHGAVTWPLVRARAVAAPLGLDDWDVVVLRSPGTPAAGLLLLDAWGRGGEARDLAAARRTGDVLLALQLAHGGWFSEVPIHGTAPARWFVALARWATLDDDVTSGAVRLLLALYEATGDVRYRDGAARGLDLLVAAQLPSGAWPLTWRPRWRRALRPSFEDLASTNDAATAGPILALLAGARTLGRSDLLVAARRGGEWLARVQAPPPQAGWAQQYDVDGRPAPGRRFEPAALASWESREMLDALLALATATGDPSFCTPVRHAALWLVGSAIAPGCWARFYATGTNAPVYIGRDGRTVPSAAAARRPYRWTGDYGIPALLAALGAAAPSTAASWRLPGDAGWCPGERIAPALTAGPRRRIAWAAERLAAWAPPPAPPCRVD